MIVTIERTENGYIVTREYVSGIQGNVVRNRFCYEEPGPITIYNPGDIDHKEGWFVKIKSGNEQPKT